MIFNPWGIWQYLHTINGSVITASFFIMGVGAWYLLKGQHEVFSKLSIKLGMAVGLAASLFAAFPSGHAQAVMVAKLQPATMAAMEGQFETEKGAGLTLFGIPDNKNEKLHFAVRVPGMLSFLVHGSTQGEIKGLKEFARADRPPVGLTFFSYHFMIGVGSFFIGFLSLCWFLLWKKKLWDFKYVLGGMIACVPLPFMVNTAGWMTAEIGRQPWLIYGMMRTNAGYSAQVSFGTAMFSLIGFILIYMLLTVLVVFLLSKLIKQGPAEA